MAHSPAVPSPSLQELLDQYEGQLNFLASEPTLADAQILKTQVLKVLLTRDAIQAWLNKNAVTATDVQRLERLDARLEAQEGLINQSAHDLLRWKDLAQPNQADDKTTNSSAWWWPTLPPPPPTRDWLWRAASVAFLSISASLILNTASRFWSGGIASAGTLAVVTQSVLTLIAGKGALTQSGREGWETFLKQRHVPKQQWQRWSCVAAGSVFLVVGGIHRSLPWVASWYNGWGWAHYEARQLGSALGNFQTALSLRPDYPEAQFHSGLVYEDLQQYEQAQESYQFVVASDPDEVPLEVWLSAHNNLARLHLLAGNEGEAAPLLIQAMDRVDVDVVETDARLAAVNYSLLKNLGWVRFTQGRYRESQTQLEEAIAFDQDVLQQAPLAGEVTSDRAAAYCLLAQVADKQKRNAAAEKAWEQCLAEANSGNPDEDGWVGVYELRAVENE